MWRFKNITLSLAGPSVGLEQVPDERDALVPLFIEIANRRAFLYPPEGRPVHHGEYIAASVQSIRSELVRTRKQLQPNRDAAEWVDAMTLACRTYLDAVEQHDSWPNEAGEMVNFEPALRELREFFREAAKHFRNDYGLAEARDLVKAMYAEDRRRLELEIENET